MATFSDVVESQSTGTLDSLGSDYSPAAGLWAVVDVFPNYGSGTPEIVVNGNTVTNLSNTANDKRPLQFILQTGDIIETNSGTAQYNANEYANP